MGVKLCYEGLQFEMTGNIVRANFMGIFYFDIKKSELNKIGAFQIDANDKSCIEFEASEKSATSKFSFLIEQGFKNLKSKLTGKKAVYISRESGIPLIGNIGFGIVDRNTSVIEVKPITGCNFDCIFCSVDQSKRTTDFVIDKDYLVEEIEKLIRFKGVKTDIALNCHGDVTLYDDLIPLVRDIRKLDNAGRIYIITNGSLLNKKMIDNLLDAGLTRFNISLHSLDNEKANILAGKKHNLQKILDCIEYIIKKCELWITPVWISGFNDKDIEDLIKYVAKLRKKSKYPMQLAIQNFLEYDYGRKPAKEISFKSFFERLKSLERKYSIKLILDWKDIIETKPLPKPFKKGDVVRAEIKCPGPLPGEMIAVANDRSIAVQNCRKKSGWINVKIISDKANIFVARPAA